jgi:hypothetical protein
MSAEKVAPPAGPEARHDYSSESLPQGKELERQLADRLAELSPEARRRIDQRVKLTAAEVDPAATATIRETLFEEAQSVWDAEGPSRVEIPGGCGLLWEGVGVYLFGARGGGKSMTAQTLALNTAMHEVPTLYFDRENAPTLGRERVTAAIEGIEGFNEAKIREFYDERHYPHFDKAWKPDDYGDAIAEAGFRVVVYDSVRELLNQLRLSSNSDDDWSELYALLGTPLIERGIAPVFLDNVGNSATHRPRGSSAKLDACPQGFRVWNVEPFSPEITGRIGIECVRSRYGDDMRLWTMTIGGGKWELPTEQDDGAPGALTTWGAVLDFLDREAEPRTYEQIAESVGVTKRTVERLARGNLRSEDADVVKGGGHGEPATLRRRGVGIGGLEIG